MIGKFLAAYRFPKAGSLAVYGLLAACASSPDFGPDFGDDVFSAKTAHKAGVWSAGIHGDTLLAIDTGFTYNGSALSPAVLIDTGAALPLTTSPLITPDGKNTVPLTGTGTDSAEIGQVASYVILDSGQARITLPYVAVISRDGNLGSVLASANSELLLDYGWAKTSTFFISLQNNTFISIDDSCRDVIMSALSQSLLPLAGEKDPPFSLRFQISSPTETEPLLAFLDTGLGASFIIMNDEARNSLAPYGNGSLQMRGAQGDRIYGGLYEADITAAGRNMTVQRVMFSSHESEGNNSDLDALAGVPALKELDVLFDRGRLYAMADDAGFPALAASQCPA